MVISQIIRKIDAIKIQFNKDIINYLGIKEEWLSLDDNHSFFGVPSMGNNFAVKVRCGLGSGNH